MCEAENGISCGMVLLLLFVVLTVVLIGVRERRRERSGVVVPFHHCRQFNQIKRMVWVVYSGCVWKLWCNAGPGLRLLFSISLDYLKYHPISFFVVSPVTIRLYWMSVRCISIQTHVLLTDKPF